MRKGFASILIVLGMIAIFIVVYLLGKPGSKIRPAYDQSSPNQVLKPFPSPSVQPIFEPLSSNAVWLTSNLVWDIQNSSLSPNEIQSLQNTFRQVGTIDTQQRNSYYDIKSGNINGDWGGFDAIEKPKPPETFQTTGILTFITHKVQGVWKVSKPGDANFCDYIKALPDNFANYKSYFIGCK